MEEDLPNGILIKLVCSNCGLERMMIIPNALESAKRAKEYRQKNQAASKSCSFFSCPTPTLDLLQDMKNVNKVLQSHVWEVNRSEHFEADSILIAVHCSNCALEQMMLVSNISSLPSFKNLISTMRNDHIEIKRQLWIVRMLVFRRDWADCEPTRDRLIELGGLLRGPHS